MGARPGITQPIAGQRRRKPRVTQPMGGQDRVSPDRWADRPGVTEPIGKRTGCHPTDGRTGARVNRVSPDRYADRPERTGCHPTDGRGANRVCHPTDGRANRGSEPGITRPMAGQARGWTGCHPTDSRTDRSEPRVTRPMDGRIGCHPTDSGANWVSPDEPTACHPTDTRTDRQRTDGGANWGANRVSPDRYADRAAANLWRCERGANRVSPDRYADRSAANRAANRVSPDGWRSEPGERTGCHPTVGGQTGSESGVTRPMARRTGRRTGCHPTDGRTTCYVGACGTRALVPGNGSPDGIVDRRSGTRREDLVSEVSLAAGEAQPVELRVRSLVEHVRHARRVSCLHDGLA